MNIAALRAELEEDLGWRRDEIRLFQNQLARVESEEDQDRLRRAVVLLVYAHFEGYCKFALLLYVNAINKKGIACGDATWAVAAAALSDIFRALRDPDRKCPEFRNDLPDDSQLHRFARDREFLEKSALFDKRSVEIPEDVVDAESNLTPTVLRKILYRLGLPHTLFQDLDGDIHRLLNIRNKIAHGEEKSGVEASKYAGVRDAAYRVMDEITRQITDALQNQRFLRPQIGGSEQPSTASS